MSAPVQTLRRQRPHSQARYDTASEAGRGSRAALAPAVAPAPATAPQPRPAPQRPIARPAVAPTGPRTHARATARSKRQSHLGFAALFSVVVGALVLGLVSLNALLAQASFRVDDLSSRIGLLEGEHLELVSEQAELSAPGRIAEWARRNGMRLPDDIRVLHAPDASTAPAGAADHAGGGT